MASILAQAAQLRAHMDAEKRTRFDARPEYLRATLFLRGSDAVAAVSDAPLEERLSASAAWRAQGNEAFAERDYDAAAQLYAQALSLFRYLYSKTADWRTTGIADANISEVEPPTGSAALPECVRLLTNLSLTATRAGKHDEAVAAATEAVRFDGEDAKALIRLTTALMDHPSLGAEALESATDAIARARRVVDDRVTGLHAAGDEAAATGADMAALKRQIMALEARIEAQSRAYRDRMQRALQQQMQEQSAAAAAAVSTTVPAPTKASSSSSLPPLPPALMAHAAARGLDLSDPRVRRELLRMDAEEHAKQAGAPPDAEDAAVAPAAKRIRDPALRQLLREMKDMTASELRHVLALLRGDSTDTSSHNSAVEDVNAPEAVALRREVVAEAVKLSDGAAEAEEARTWRSWAIRAVRWGATILIACFVVYRIAMLLFPPRIRGSGDYNAPTTPGEADDIFGDPSPLDEL